MLDEFNQQRIFITMLELNDKIEVKGIVLNSLERKIAEIRGRKPDAIVEALQLIAGVDVRMTSVEKL